MLPVFQAAGRAANKHDTHDSDGQGDDRQTKFKRRHERPSWSDLPKQDVNINTRSGPLARALHDARRSPHQEKGPATRRDAGKRHTLNLQSEEEGHRDRPLRTAIDSPPAGNLAAGDTTAEDCVMNITVPIPSLGTAQVPIVGDIVSFRFPFPSIEECRTRAPRPCLVIDVEDYLGGAFVEFVPSTRGLLPEPTPTDICVDHTALFPEHHALGSWRFLPDLHERFDIAHPGFRMGSEDCPVVLGRAYGSALDMVEHLRGQLQATREEHIAERRARRRAARRRR
jgi:hypothetical protein